MIEQFIALIVFMHNPEAWKEKVYDNEYNNAIHNHRKLEVTTQSTTLPRVIYTTSAISWYGTGTPGLYTACWDIYPKGIKFKVSYNGNSVVVTCNDRGHFRELGRMLDLSKESFERLAPLDTGIIRGAEIEVMK